MSTLTIVVLGASGDLAKKKTFPALWRAFKTKNLVDTVNIVGYARSKLTDEEFKARIITFLETSNSEEEECRLKFISRCSYLNGLYDDASSFAALNSKVEALEGAASTECRRIFYLALPGSVFLACAKNLKENVYSAKGRNCIIVEKPFGMDLDSCRELSMELSQYWHEHEIYRIDHYLGKEMIKNLIHLRFSNMFFAAFWNRNFIDNVQITFKETIGTEGRGGYFDEFGIIRDVMQNHLLQILCLIAMERPCSSDPEDIRNEKVKVLKSIPPVLLDETILGQYGPSADGKSPGYLDDSSVPAGSTQCTYAATVLHINNERWEGVPFIMKAGKALSEKKVEVRVQMRDVPGLLYPEISRNELVIRVQPDEAIYIKVMNKKPGFDLESTITELNLDYHQRYPNAYIPEAYEALLVDILKEDHSNFVRDDELDFAWRIFTPLLQHIETNKINPIKYAFGSRGPEGIDSFTQKFGFKYESKYAWTPSRPIENTPSKQPGKKTAEAVAKKFYF